MKKLIVFLLMIIISITSANFCLANEKKDHNPVCIIKTSMGDIFVELFAKEAPDTVNNFIALAEGEKEYTNPVKNSKVKNHFYDNLIFHRVIKKFMIQGGCPLGNGTSGPGYTFKDEINAKSLGLDKIKVMQPDGGVHQYLLVRSQQDYSRVIVMPLARKMGIKSQQEFQNQQQEIQQKISQLTLKECYENIGYEYNDELKSHFLH